MVNLKSILDEENRQTKFDENLATRIEAYVNALMNRNQEHVYFFGSNLTGVYPLRFKTSDRNEWFMDIKDIDEFEIAAKVLQLARTKGSGLMETWVRATDAFNLDCLYTMHRFLNSNLPEKKKQKAINDTAMALNIKLLGSIMAMYFKFDVDERVAQEVYARLSRKFYIKRFGNWREVLIHRSEDITDHRATSWRKVLTEFTDNAAIAQCISDIQGRLRSMIKYIWEVFEKVRQDEMKHNKTSMVIDTGGVKIIQDLNRKADKFKDYALDTVLDFNSFYKPELITIIGAELTTMPVKLLGDVLAHTVKLANGKDSTKINHFITEVIEYTIETIRLDRSAAANLHDLGWLLNKIRLLITAPKSSQREVLEMRKFGELVVRESAHTRNATLIMSLRTGLILYIVARTFTINHYS